MATKIHFLCLNIYTLLLILLLLCPNTSEVPPALDENDVESAQVILNTTADILHDTYIRMGALEDILYNNYKTAPYEVGYINFMLYEKYRRMVDIFNSSSVYVRNLYIHELIMYLDEIEHLFWDIEHLANMLHEIERKYGFPQGFNAKFDEKSATRLKYKKPTIPTTPTTRSRKFPTRYGPDHRVSDFLLSTKRSTRDKSAWGWPLDYGWEIERNWRGGITPASK